MARKEAAAPAAAVEQPPYPCAAPLTSLDLSTCGEGLHADGVRCVERLLDATFEAAQDLLLSRPRALQALPSCSGDCYAWRPVSFQDPHERVNEKVAEALGNTLPPGNRAPFAHRVVDERPMHLLTMQHINGFHMTKAHMFFTGVTPEEFLTEVHCTSKEKRKSFAPNMKNYVRWFRNPSLVPWATPTPDDVHTTAEELENAQLCVLAAARDQVRDTAAVSAHRHWYVESNVFGAPPPVSSREALLAVEKLYSPGEDCYYIYGCSLDTSEHPSVWAARASSTSSAASAKPAGDFNRCVRAAYMFCWKLDPCRDPASSLILSTRATMVSVMNPGGWTPSFILSWFKSEIGKEVAFMRKTLYSVVLERRLQQAAAGRPTSTSWMAGKAADPRLLGPCVLSNDSSPTGSALLSDDGANTVVGEEQSDDPPVPPDRSAPGWAGATMGGCAGLGGHGHKWGAAHGAEAAVDDEDADWEEGSNASDEQQGEDARLLIGLEDEEFISVL